GISQEWPGFNFGPEALAAILGVAGKATSLGAPAPASGEKLTTTDATAGATGSSTRAACALAAAGAASLCASTMRGARQRAVTANSTAADAMNVSRLAARQGDVFLRVLCIISILCCS